GGGGGGKGGRAAGRGQAHLHRLDVRVQSRPPRGRAPDLRRMAHRLQRRRPASPGRTGPAAAGARAGAPRAAAAPTAPAAAAYVRPAALRQQAFGDRAQSCASGQIVSRRKGVDGFRIAVLRTASGWTNGTEGAPAENAGSGASRARERVAAADRLVQWQGGEIRLADQRLGQQLVILL